MNKNWNLININKINLKSIKILFLGYGAVAKCVLNYFKYYFDFDLSRVYIIDKYENALYGPVQDSVPKTNKLFVKIQSENFDYYIIEKLKFKKHDLIIDLTFASNTYYFIKRCLELDINYINTSTEDGNDDLNGSSIAFQHIVIDKIYEKVKSEKKILSNVLLEFGQNPGLIQHYVIYAFNELNKMKHPNAKDIWDLAKLKHVIHDYKIGTILFSEIDSMVKSRDVYDNSSNKIYNTWSVSGLLGEGLDHTEISYSRKNRYYKPKIPNHIVSKDKISLFEDCIKNNDASIPYNLIFLNELGLNSTLTSICPALTPKGNLIFENFEGRLIHHNEMFDLAQIFGSDSPLMSYVYKINKYALHSIEKYMHKSIYSSADDLATRINNINDDFFVFDNIGAKPDNKIIGWDSIGSTIFCGKNKVESIYWCGSILSASDTNVMDLFTPTIIQVAAGVLAGLSWIMEPKNENKGLLKPTQLYTPYILSKSIPLLGKFFFTEIPAKSLNKSTIKFDIDKIV